jgi:hypothetical protein
MKEFAGGIVMKNKMALILMIIAAGAVISCESLFNDQIDALESNYFHGTRQFVASDGAQDDYFGYRVAISADGNTVAVGAWWDDVVYINQGSVYVYRWSGSEWKEMKITAHDGTTFNLFGNSVAMSADGNTLAVAASGYDNSKGVVYLYKWNGRSYEQMQQKLMKGSPVNNDAFGISLALSYDGNVVCVGTDGENTNTGSVYVFHWDGSLYKQVQRIFASDGAEQDYFGTSVSMSSDGYSVAVGAPFGDGKSSNSGSAYVYRWDGSSWSEIKIKASNGALNDEFGKSVALSADGNTVVIGAPQGEGKAAHSGAAYVYRWNGSLFVETRIIASDGGATDNFGISAAISADGNMVAIGASGDDNNGTDSGSMFVYRWNGSSWIETIVTAPNGAAQDAFGTSLAVSADGGTLVVGADYDDAAFANQGSVWLYAK